MKTLVIIPARGGSKGIPKKNIKSLAGKPLIEYTISAALALFPAEDICVSSDSEDIIAVAKEFGIQSPFVRPASISTDTSSAYEVIMHALAFYEGQGKHYEAVIMLQATSPFRTAQHLKKALELYNSSIDMVVSVVETAANPYYVLFEENEQGYLEKSKNGNFTSRQECPKVWQYNGALYIMNVNSLKEKNHLQFKKVIPFQMDDYSSVDIDTPLDWDFAEFLVKKRHLEDHL